MAPSESFGNDQSQKRVTFIKQLTIDGFRSYREQVILDDLSPRLNIVVGENGTGKSNFFQAIEFVLGENRFSRMSRIRRQPLLYEGSGPRRLNASVEIVFNNVRRFFPTDTDQVYLKRVVSTKNDEFFINHKRVGAEEASSLLESAGFSRSNPYYIVKQGKVSQLANCSNEERLQMLKEIAGAMTFEERWKAALEEMSRGRNVLAQIPERMAELRERIHILEQENNELRQFALLDKKKRLLEYAINQLELQAVERKLEELNDTGHEEISESLIQARRKNNSIKEKIANFVEVMKGVDKTIWNHTNEIEHLGKELVQKHTEETRLVLELGDLERESRDLEGTKRTNVEADLARIEEDVQRRETKLQELQEENKFEEKTKEKDTLRLSLYRQRRNQLFEKEGRGSYFASREERDAWIAQEIGKIDGKLIQNTAKMDLLKAEMSLDKSTLEEHGRKILEHEVGEHEDEVQRSIEEIKSETRALKEELAPLRDQRTELWRNQHSLNQELDQLREEKATKGHRLKSAIGQSCWDSLESVKKVLDVFKSQPESREANLVLNGYRGLLIDSFSCDSVLYTAVDVVASNCLFNHVVKDDRVANVIIKMINQLGLPGNITLMPLNLLHPPDRTISENAFAHAVYLVANLRFDESDVGRAVRYIFGKTFVCRDLDSASEYAKSKPYVFVTLEGDKASKGRLTGGYYDPKKSKKRLYDEYNEAKRKVDDKEAEMNSLETTLERLTTRIAKLEIMTAERESHLAHIQDRRVRHKNEHTNLRTLLSDLEDLYEKKKQALNGLKADRKSLELKRESLTNELEQDMTAHLSPDEREELENLNYEITELLQKSRSTHDHRIQIKAEINKLENILKNRLYKQRDEIKKKLSEMNTRSLSIKMTEVQTRLDDIRNKIQRTEVKMGEFGKAKEDVEAQRKNVQQEIDKRKETANTWECKITDLTDKLHKNATRRSNLNQQQTSLKEKQRTMGPYPNEEALRNLLRSKTLSQLYKEKKGVNQRLRSLENVNQKAALQYSESQQLEENLQRRQTELDRGAEAIQELMNVMLQKKNDALKLTFKQVMQGFKETFQALVPDGCASMVLIREESQQSQPGTQNFENYTGLAINVSFTGGAPSQRDLSHLSGGQKTVVALALILAIQACDPAPFYLFDEVDQALDSTYRARVADLLRQRSRTSQFICTTFRRELVQQGKAFFRTHYINKVSHVRKITKSEALEFIVPSTP